MTIGRGRYDALCSIVHSEMQADLTILMVVNGHMGDGFSVNCNDPEMVKDVPALLETLAGRIREELNRAI